MTDAAKDPSTSVSRRYGLAAGLALVLMTASGVGHRLLLSRYANASQSVPIAPGTLASLPMSMEEWHGSDVPLDERIVAATDTDDHVHRNYVRAGREVVGLWVAYGVRFRDLMPHRPEVCYPGGGWTLESTRQIELEAADGAVVQCSLHRFSRGVLGNKGITVLNYYLVDGQYGSDVSAVRKRVWRFASDLQYVAQVQVTGLDDPLRGTTEQSVREFAALSAPVIRDLLDQAVASVSPGKAGDH